VFASGVLQSVQRGAESCSRSQDKLKWAGKFKPSGLCLLASVLSNEYAYYVHIVHPLANYLRLSWEGGWSGVEEEEWWSTLNGEYHASEEEVLT